MGQGSRSSEQKSVSVCSLRALNFECLDLRTWSLAHSCVFMISRSVPSIKYHVTVTEVVTVTVSCCIGLKDDLVMVSFGSCACRVARLCTSLQNDTLHKSVRYLHVTSLSFCTFIVTVTSAKEDLFYPAFVVLFVCFSVCPLASSRKIVIGFSWKFY